MGKPLELSLFEGMSDDEWKSVYMMARQQGVLAVCFDAIKGLPKAIGPSRSLFIQWALACESIEKRFERQKEALGVMEGWFGAAGLKFMLMKGFSVAKYFPVPEHRECGDIDIYMGKDYVRGNEVFRGNGCDVEEDYYRHAHLGVRGVMVENHCMVSDTRGRKDNVALEEWLIAEAERVMAGSDGVVVWPSVDFSAVFLNWHAEGHFMFEKIQLRHICDWALFLRNEGARMDVELFRSIKGRFTFGRLSDILTSIALDFLGLEEAELPAGLVEDARGVDLNLRDRVLADVLEAERTDRSGGVWRQRVRVLSRVVRDSWKIREVFGMSAWRVVGRKVFWVFRER